jgi:two-component system NtrC family sensor kinase
MSLLDINIQYRVIIGISAMVFLFSSFLIVFITNQRKKLQYHKDLQLLHEQQRQALLKENSLLEKRVNERTAELLQQKNSLQIALSELKASQLQLVQREKMASLGELTAGIAHEIQNPLNFVNNFAEINTELLSELKEHIDSEKLPAETKDNIGSLVEDAIQNLEKIRLHGKSADSIVKNMLQHSRTSTGEKQLTDINSLANEYLKLSYHGFRAKDKSFNVTIKTAFDEGMDKINIVPQDIGRVFLNLYNNAFYSINEKLKKKAENYNPVIWVTTKMTGVKAEIKIRDNGLGIPKKYIEKIYQPFFTTKPTGLGTGLGLSLSYDIIKAHMGELKVESVEGEFAEFIIFLPY